MRGNFGTDSDSTPAGVRFRDLEKAVHFVDVKMLVLDAVIVYLLFFNEFVFENVYYYIFTFPYVYLEDVFTGSIPNASNDFLAMFSRNYGANLAMW